MRWNDEQRAERAARLLTAAASVATEAARLMYETEGYSAWSLSVNAGAATLNDLSEAITQLRRSKGVANVIKGDSADPF